MLLAISAGLFSGQKSDSDGRNSFISGDSEREQVSELEQGDQAWDFSLFDAIVARKFRANGTFNPFSDKLAPYSCISCISQLLYLTIVVTHCARAVTGP